MKQYIIIFLFVVGSLYAAPDGFAQANKLYQQKDFQKAYELYQAIATKDQAVWYNMGNCSYHLGNTQDALACWRLAKQYDGADTEEDLAYNIAAVEQEIGVQERQRLVFIVIQAIPLLVLQLLFLCFWFLLFFFIKKCNRGKKYRSLLIAWIFLMCTIFGVSLKVKYEEQQFKGIVMNPNTQLFAGPNEQYHVLESIPQAQAVEIIETREQWYKVKYKNKVGWIMRNAIAVV